MLYIAFSFEKSITIFSKAVLFELAKRILDLRSSGRRIDIDHWSRVVLLVIGVFNAFFSRLKLPIFSAISRLVCTIKSANTSFNNVVFPYNVK